MGDAAGWTHFADLEVVSGRVGVSDPAFCRDNPLVVELAPGVYPVHAHVVGSTVSEMRLGGGDEAARGDEIGWISVDFAMASVFDAGVFEALQKETALDDDTVWGDAWVEEVIAIGLHGVAHCDPARGRGPMAIVQSGYGDGRYPVFELRSGEALVGVAAMFLGPDLTCRLD